MRVPKFMLAGLLSLAAASPAWAGNILWFEDGTVGTSAVGGAIAMTPHTYTFTNNPSTLLSLLTTGGPWDLVIYGEQNNSSSFPTAGAALTQYVNNGGRVIGATWINSTTAFCAMMQGGVVTNNVTSMTTTSHPIFANCPATMTLVNPGIGTFSLCYTAQGGATALGTAGSGAAVILGNGGRTLLNCGCMTTYSPISVGQQFIANEINFLITHVITGRVLYDRYVVDSTGIGNSLQQGIPLAGMRVDARSAAGTTVGTTFADAQGNFTLIVSGQTGSLVVAAENSATALRAVAAGPPLSATFASSVSFATDQNLGTFTLNEVNDPGGTGRAPVNAAFTIKQAYDWAKARTTDVIPFLEVLHDTTAAPTSYTEKSGLVAASMRLSGAAANSDGWDVDVIRKTYARHLLGSIAADTTIAPVTTFDAESAAENSFAEGFGYAFSSLLSGSRYFVDGTSSSAANVIDLESPAGILSPKSVYCSAWVAPALYDLVDPANEAWDSVDGSGSAGERVFTVVDSFTSTVTASSFYSAWLAKGFGAAGISKDFVHHGLLPDDSDEPNDTPAEATQIDQFGFVRSGRTLNIANDDWYAFTLAFPVDSVTTVVTFSRNMYPLVALLVEITDATGSVIATGTAPDTVSPYRAVTNPLPAGKYLLHVALTSGGPLPAYSMQAYSKLLFRSDKFPPWTLGQPYLVNVSIYGGIPPYGLAILAPYKGPNGLTLHGDTGIVDGTPAGPPEGLPVGGTKVYSFLLNAVDGATPTNTASQLITFVLNDRVRSPFGEFTAFPRGKAIDRAWARAGGTAPYVVTLDEGTIPHGLSIVDGSRLAFSGTPDTAGASSFELTTTDVAGSTATSSATGVVCVPMGPNSIPAGPTACGWTFDALMGSNVSIAIATDKKQPIRTQLRAVLLDVDGATPLEAYVKVKKGKVTVSRYLGETTGRFYCILAADDTGAATSLVATAKITPPKKAQGDSGAALFGGAATLEIPVPALAGAAVSFSAKPDKSGLQLTVLRVVDPSGKTVELPEGTVKSAKGAVALKYSLGTTGVWKVVLGALAGPSGQFTWTYGVKQPKGAVYSAE